jgi:hypothetical protein
MAIDWAQIKLLEARLRWHRGKASYDRKKLAEWKITGDRAHYWLAIHEHNKNLKAIATDKAEILTCRGEINKWKSILDPEEAEIHKLEVAINQLRPKTQQWPLGGLVAPGVLWSSQRFDQGKDFEIAIFTSVRAPGNGECLEWASDRAWPYGFGDPYAVIRLDDGPWHAEAIRLGASPEFYVGHCNEPLVKPGQRFSVGQPLSRTDHGFSSGLGWCEFGHWPPGPMTEGSRFAGACATVTR